MKQQLLFLCIFAAVLILMGCSDRSPVSSDPIEGVQVSPDYRSAVLEKANNGNNANKAFTATLDMSARPSSVDAFGVTPEGIYWIKGQVTHGTIAGDIQGTATSVLDLEINLNTGGGTARGTLAISPTSIKGQTVSGSWVANVKAEFTGFLLSGKIRGGVGSGDLEGTTMKADFTDAPLRDNKFVLTGKIGEDDD